MCTYLDVLGEKSNLLTWAIIMVSPDPTTNTGGLSILMTKKSGRHSYSVLLP